DPGGDRSARRPSGLEERLPEAARGPEAGGREERQPDPYRGAGRRRDDGRRGRSGHRSDPVRCASPRRGGSRSVPWGGRHRRRDMPHPELPTLDPHTAVVVVDVQNDFADPGGSLYVDGGDQIIDAVNDLIAAAREAGAVIAYT